MTGVTNPTDFGSPNITISGFDATGLTPPLGRIDTTGHIDQTFTYTVGSHQFRFGGDYRYSRLDVFYDANAPGTFTFDGTQGPFATTNPTDTWGVGKQSSHRWIARRTRGFPFRARRTGTPRIAYGNQQRIYNLNGFSVFGSGHLESNSEADAELWLELGVSEPDL